MGTVEAVGLKTTRLRALSGEVVVVPNSDLTKSRVQNFKQMRERRIEVKLGFDYATPPAKLAALPAQLKAIVDRQELTRFDRAHFAGFGESSLDVAMVWFALTPDYNKYMDIQQAMNLEIMELCRREGLEFAFPTRTIVMATGAEVRLRRPLESGAEISAPH